MGMKENYQRAVDLAKAGRYEEAQSILMGIDHPKAESLLHKVNQAMLVRNSRQSLATAVPSAPSVTMVNINQDNSPGCLVQLLYYIVFGWWLGAAWMFFSWAFMLTIIGLPVAIWMINRISQVIALRSPKQKISVVTSGNATLIRQGNDQINLLIRIVWFFVFGWWLSGIWMLFAYAVCATILLLPAGFWMFDKTPGILTLQR